MTSLATSLPEHTNDGYVAAAYIVFFAIVLIYVTIMAVRLGRVERKVEQLRGDVVNGEGPARARGATSAGETTGADRQAGADDTAGSDAPPSAATTREHPGARETV